MQGHWMFLSSYAKACNMPNCLFIQQIFVLITTFKKKAVQGIQLFIETFFAETKFLRITDADKGTLLLKTS